MYPSMNFRDVILKTQTFSHKASMKGHLQKLRDRRDGVNQTEMHDEDEDIDLANPQNNGNQSGAPQARLQRQPDGSHIQPQRNGGGNQRSGGMDFGGDPMEQKSAPSNNAQRNGGGNQRKGGMDFGGDPMDHMRPSNGMDFGGDPAADERDLARSMYG